MPIYEYGCEACGHQLEVTQKISDAPLKTCPECGKDALQKLISATAFVLKGGGWYKDGYGSADKNRRSEKQVTDRLQKAVDEDKKKSAPASSSSESGSSSGSSSSGSPSSGTSSGSSSGSSSGGGSDGGKSAGAHAA